MAGLNVTARNAMLDANSAVWPPDTMSLHTADPGNSTSAAAGEVTGGSPAYARVSVTWSAAATGSKSASSSEVFNVPAATITHAGYWRSTTYLGSRALDTPQTFATQGTYTVAATGATETLT